jgi:hypothetical protein
MVHVNTPIGGEYIRCECGAWFVPVFKNQTTCVKCRKKARYEECHQHAPEIWMVV